MTREIPARSLSRGQQEQLQRSKSFEDLAERLVAEEYGLEGLSMDAEWWDLRHPNTPAKTEVKSTSTTVGEKYPGDGRFRLWEGQTRSLLSSDARGVAWYAFVLLDEDAGVLRIRRAEPSTVSGWVADRGGWNQSGHESQGRQHKLPYGVVF
jgi:hypothetical protein